MTSQDASDIVRRLQSIRRRPAPAVRVFVSHKMEDKDSAEEIARRINRHSRIEVWIDTLDPALNGSGDDLTEYIHKKLEDCTHLIAVISNRTVKSWWVPFEIGLACARNYPLATFALENIRIPDFLLKWPYLDSLDDVDHYAQQALATEPDILDEGSAKVASEKRAIYAQSFHENLKKALGQ